MYAKSTRSSSKRDVQKFRSAQRDNEIAHPRRAQFRELRAMRMCPRSGQIFWVPFTWVGNQQIFLKKNTIQVLEHIYMKIVCNFKCDQPNSFREVCTEKLPFFKSKNHVCRFFYFFLVDRFNRNLYQRCNNAWRTIAWNF